MATAESRQTLIDDACATAEQFAKHYFENMDKGRHKIPKFYMDDAFLVWNGNSVSGKDAITNFYKNLPISETTLSSLDAQPVLEAVEGQRTILVIVAGVIKFPEKPAIPFQQNFVLTVCGKVWKVATDCFRFQETV